MKLPKKQHVLAALILGAALIAMFFILRPSPRDQAMADAERAIITHSPEALYPYITDQEVEAGLTRENWIALYRELIEPRLRRVKRFGNFQRSKPDTVNALARAYVEIPGGASFLVHVDFDMSNRGPRANIMSLLTQAWMIEFLENNPGREQDPKRFFASFYQGLRKDLPVLKRIGVKKFVPTDPLRKIYTWEEILATEQRQIEQGRL